MATSHINDAQPAVSQTNVRSQVNAGIVGTAVLQRIIHALKEFRRSRFRPIKVNNAANTTHRCSLVALHF
ncbi:MAG TPA: hypothetical protein VKB60_05390 [Terriglobales bacterium]|nr:hypothetical protein [Terriglobales bacterium]